MHTAVLFFFRYRDREGILPVNTYVYEENAAAYLDEVHFYLLDILQKFIKEPLDGTFWLEEKESFDPEEMESYGYVYSELKADDEIQLPADPYEAARLIAVGLIASDSWEDEVKENDRFTFTGYTVDDIPSVGPELEYDAPVDSRYTVGESLISKRGTVLVYAGVLHDAIRPQLKDYTQQVNSKGHESDAGTKVLIGVDNKDFIREQDMIDFTDSSEIEVHPLPLIAVRDLPKGYQWFALHPQHPKVEGYGKTQAEAKKSLALKALLG